MAEKLKACPWHPFTYLRYLLILKHDIAKPPVFVVECGGGCRGPTELSESAAIESWNRPRGGDSR